MKPKKYIKYYFLKVEHRTSASQSRYLQVCMMQQPIMKFQVDIKSYLIFS